MRRQPVRTWIRALVLLSALGASSAHALEATWSGFATLGYAQSNSDYTYQRFIDRDGTFKRDSLVAGQLDLRLSPQWSTTVQLRAAPAGDDDHRWRVEPSWAFLAWRPDNDWLLRAGKMRVPLYFHSESLDVGVARDMVRLPHEMYSIAPISEFTGLYATRSFAAGLRDLGVDAYAGQADTQTRLWARDGVPPFIQPGPVWVPIQVKIAGLVLTARDPDLTWRLGVHMTSTSRRDGLPFSVRYPRVEVAPGIGYWQASSLVPGPGIPGTDRVRNIFLTAGVDWQVGDGWRIASEVASLRQMDTEVGYDALAGYVAVFKRIGDFTPYVSVAREKSSSDLIGWAQRLRAPSLPPQVPGASLVNAAQRLAGENVFAYDQDSIALGVSYALSPTAKLKAEWMRTRVGDVSKHFDTPPGKPDPAGLRVNTLSVNFNVAF